MRWTYCSGTSGRSKLTTWLTPGMSIPRAAMSVATSTGTWPDLKAAIARSRCGWDLLPWIAAAGDAGGGKLADDLVGAMLGAAEHQRPLRPVLLQEQGQQRRLFGLVDVGDALVDPLDGGRRRRHRDFGRVGQIGVGQLLDRLRHGRREEQGLALSWAPELTIRFSAWMKPRSSIWSASSRTRISSCAGQRALVDEVEQAAGRGDEDVEAARRLRARSCRWGRRRRRRRP